MMSRFVTSARTGTPTMVRSARSAVLILKHSKNFFANVIWAAQGGVLKKVCTVSVDGTKIHANAGGSSAVRSACAQKMLIN